MAPLTLDRDSWLCCLEGVEILAQLYRLALFKPGPDAADIDEIISLARGQQ